MLVCCPYLLYGQSKNVFFLSRDTLSMNNQFVIRTKYRCDENLYIIKDTISHIIEVYNGSGMLRERKFYKAPGDIHSFAFIDYTKIFNCMDHSKLWKILKEMVMPELLICL